MPECSFQVEIIVRIYHMLEFQQDVIQHENYTTFCIQFMKKSVILMIFLLSSRYKCLNYHVFVKYKAHSKSAGILHFGDFSKI